MYRYLISVGVSLSILLNALTGGRSPETFSLRSARARNGGKRWGCVMCRLLDVLDENHCDRTVEWWDEHFIANSSQKARCKTSQSHREARGLQP